MRTFRLIALLALLLGVWQLSQEPVHADGCSDACTYQLNVCEEDADQDYDWCYDTAMNQNMTCTGDAYTAYDICINGAGGFPAFGQICEAGHRNSAASAPAVRACALHVGFFENCWSELRPLEQCRNSSYDPSPSLHPVTAFSGLDYDCKITEHSLDLSLTRKSARTA